uniref:(+)-neomenthol dehydrogenase-like n=1 Tax=Ananas comosus var. bracteatus TaxID=296719 RepID=A0A6V7QMH3_ANACO|nr:unnamed protein product [Ananas comosus var. bracteatus]
MASKTNGDQIPSPNRIAVVTGGNKGIGLEICRQLASDGVRVILTARDEKRGLEAVEKLKQSGLSDVIFHRLDVTDHSSIDSLSEFIKSTFGKLDILVNNAAIAGATTDYEVLRSSIVNSKFIPNESVRKEMDDVDRLTEEKIDEMVRSFLNDFKVGDLTKNNWPTIYSAYTVSKVAVSAYTRIIAKKYPAICANCVHPGYVKTDINGNTGTMPVEEGAKGPVMAALLPHGSPSGLFYDKTEVSSFMIAVVTGGNKGIGLEICRQLASNGVRVILTARDEKRGLEAVENLKQSGLSDVIFHRLDVTDHSSIDSLSEFIKSTFGKLDILTRGIPNITTQETYKWAEECLDTNYYGVKRVTEALIPRLLSSESPRIVNVSSYFGKLQFIPNESVRKEMDDVDRLTEEKIDEMVRSFLNDFKVET